LPSWRPSLGKGCCCRCLFVFGASHRGDSMGRARSWQKTSGSVLIEASSRWASLTTMASTDQPGSHSADTGRAPRRTGRLRRRERRLTYGTPFGPPTRGRSIPIGRNLPARDGSQLHRTVAEVAHQLRRTAQLEGGSESPTLVGSDRPLVGNDHSRTGPQKSCWDKGANSRQVAANRVGLRASPRAAEAGQEGTGVTRKEREENCPSSSSTCAHRSGRD
jgi:hypothetical protein